MTEADETGLLAVGGTLDVETLLEAYRNGIFPWPYGEQYPLTWFSPPQRGVLFFDRFRIPRSVKVTMKRSSWEIRCDTAFSEVVQECAKTVNRREDATWITRQIIDGYSGLHRGGFAHSIECFSGETLVGGLYGVSIGQMFAGESMFYRENDASKFCLVALVRHLEKNGCTWLDCQQLTPLLESFGAVEIERSEFLKILAAALKKPAVTFPFSPLHLTG